MDYMEQQVWTIVGYTRNRKCSDLAKECGHGGRGRKDGSDHRLPDCLGLNHCTHESGRPDHCKSNRDPAMCAALVLWTLGNNKIFVFF